jgi:hypothetical protein
MNPILQQQEEINILLDKLILMDIVRSDTEEKLKLMKSAGLIDQVKAGAASVIEDVKTGIKERVEKEGVVGAIATYLTFAYLSKFTLLGLVVFPILESFGISPGSIIASVQKSLTDKVKEGNVTPEAATSTIEAAVPAGTVAASYVMLQILKKAEQEGELFKVAGRFGRGKPKIRSRSRHTSTHTTPHTKTPRRGLVGGAVAVGGAALVGLKDVIFGTATGQGKKRGFALSVLMWAIKLVVFAILFEAGKSVVGKAYEAVVPAAKDVVQKSISDLPTKAEHNLTPKAGTQYHINNEKTYWIVPLISNNIEKTLLFWAQEIYPELKPYLNDIAKSSEFLKTINVLKTNYDQYTSPAWLELPREVHTRQELADRFIHAGVAKLSQSKA